MEKENKGVRKISPISSKKIRLVHRAYKENKCILITEARVRDLGANGTKKQPLHSIANKDRLNMRFELYYEKIYCRVYQIKEFSNKPYAILIPLNRPRLIFDEIDNLNIPIDLPEKEILIEDLEENRDLEALFKKNNKVLPRIYNSLGDYINKSLRPVMGFPYKTSFYFRYKYLDMVKKSFEEWFSTDLEVIKCRTFKINEKETKRVSVFDIPHKNEKYRIECEPLQEGERPRFGVVNIVINRNALVDWICANPSIAQVIDVVSPSAVNEQVGIRFFRIFARYMDDIKDEAFNEELKYIHRGIGHKRPK